MICLFVILNCKKKLIAVFNKKGLLSGIQQRSWPSTLYNQRNVDNLGIERANFYSPEMHALEWDIIILIITTKSLSFSLTDQPSPLTSRREHIMDLTSGSTKYAISDL